MGIEADTIEATYDATQWEPALVDALANGSYDVIVLGTSNMIEYVQRIAPQYPDRVSSSLTIRSTSQAIRENAA